MTKPYSHSKHFSHERKRTQLEIAIVACDWFMAHPDMIQSEVADKYGIAQSTFSIALTKFLKEKRNGTNGISI